MIYGEECAEHYNDPSVYRYDSEPTRGYPYIYRVSRIGLKRTSITKSIINILRPRNGKKNSF